MAAGCLRVGVMDFSFYSFSSFIIISLCSVCCNRASEIPRPRGVSISKAGLYVPNQDFTCFDGSNVIPFTQINDDYCDCIDGSDEPGTAACPNSFFHCTNAGYRPMNIPSAQVNDGICDCCDGTDEYASRTHCENTCMDMGKAERILAQKRAEIARAGNQARLQASATGKQLKQEKREKLQQLERDREDAERIREEKDKVKSEVETLEKSALEAFNQQRDLADQEAQLEDEEEAKNLFQLLDTNQDNELSADELTARQTFDQNRDGVVSPEEAAFFLDNADKISYDDFLESGWNRMKPFVMREKGLFTPPSSDADDKGAKGDDDELFPGVGTVEDVTGEYHQQRKEDDDGETQGDEEDHDEEEEFDEEGEEEAPAEQAEVSGQLKYEYDEDTQKLVDAASAARSEAEEADRTVRDIQRELNQLQEYLEKDFGPEEEFAPLEGQCYEYTDREYTYKLCPFDQASQRPKSGGSETRLGVWKGWSGPAEDKYSAMMYDKGQSCWNGPQRSTFVKVQCGIENELVGVSEPNKCEYAFAFNSPSACRPSDGQPEPAHDEL